MLKKTALAVLLAAVAMVLLSAPVVISERVAIARSEAFRADIKSGSSWDALALRLDRRPLHMLSVSFRAPQGRCGYAYLGEKDQEGAFVAENGDRLPLKSFLDPSLAATRARCPLVSVDSHERFGFSKIDFEVEFGADGKVVSTTPTRAWD
jgi:hypothetical protein